MTYAEETREQLTNSIERTTPIRFSYLKPRAPMPERRMLSVYELSDDGETFLGFDHWRQELRRFDISRIVADIEYAEDEGYVYPEY